MKLAREMKALACIRSERGRWVNECMFNPRSVSCVLELWDEESPRYFESIMLTDGSLLSEVNTVTIGNTTKRISEIVCYPNKNNGKIVEVTYLFEIRDTYGRVVKSRKRSENISKNQISSMKRKS